DFDGGVLAHALDINRLGEKRVFILVEGFDELDDAAFVVENAAFPGAFVLKDDAYTLVQEGHSAQARLAHLILEIDEVNDDGRVVIAAHVGDQLNARAGFLRFADDAQIVQGLAAPVFLFMDFPVLADDDAEPRGQRVHDRRAHAVQAARYFIALAAEFAAR